MLQRFFLLLPLIWCCVCSAANAQIRQSQHLLLRAALERDDEATAERLLREMLRVAPQSFARNNYDYLLARLLLQRDAGNEASQLLQQVGARNGPLAGYALWHQAGIARQSANSQEEQRLLQKFIAQHPDHLLRERAIGRLSESYLRTRQYQSVLNTLKNFSSARRDATATIGEAQLALRQHDAARASFETALTGGAMDDAALRAVTGLDRLDQNAPITLAEADHLRRARIYQFNRQFGAARHHWLIVVSQFPQSPKRAEALFQLGRGHFLENDFGQAAKWYERVYSEFPDSDEGEQGFYYVGHCFQYLNDPNRAIARYEEFLRRYPTSTYVGYAYLNAIDTLRSANRDNEALQWAGRAQTTLREPFIVTTALFRQALIQLTQENYQTAYADFTALRNRNLSLRGQVATTNQPEVQFMRAYCLEKSGKFDEAINEYLALPEARSGAAGYYSQRAGERLRALGANLRAKNMIAARRESFLSAARAANAQGNAAAAKTAANQALRLVTDEAAHNEMLKMLRAAYPKLRGYQAPTFTLANAGRNAPLNEGDQAVSGTNHQTIAGELIFLGLYDEAGPELAETGTADRTTLAYYCARGDCAQRAFQLGDPLLNALPEDFRLELLPRETAEILYPFPFRAALARHATTRGVDPRFVLSIVRQESSYNPRVKSQAAARGLLQFISSTSDQIAAQLQLANFAQNDLYDADTAILFGAQYMKNLFDEFSAPQAVAAAYNGSEDSVRRWRARAESTEVDRLVVEVLKRETKDYVFKVMNNYAAYQKIYSQDWQRAQ